jgi:PIN domain nuclease of toxin-antitoxin system
MRLLLDTCAFLWLVGDVERLSSNARAVILDPDNECWLSAASLWEAVVKHAAGRLEIDCEPEPVGAFLRAQRQAHGVESLAVDEAAVAHVIALPDLHRDPFDRLLVCQAIEHGLAIVTPDPAIRGYPVKTLW